jgi:hypothetical protein
LDRWYTFAARQDVRGLLGSFSGRTAAALGNLLKGQLRGGADPHHLVTFWIYVPHSDSTIGHGSEKGKGKMLAKLGSSAVDDSTTSVIALACMPEARDKIFLRVPPDVKKDWRAAVDKLRTNQTKLGEAVVRWFLRLDLTEKFEVMVNAEPGEAGGRHKQDKARKRKRKPGGVVHDGGKNLHEAEKP